MDMPLDAARETAPAKLNLFLEILGRRPDGFHELRSVFFEHPDLHDVLRAVPDDELSLSTDDPALSAGPDNLVLRALAALREAAGVRAGLRVWLEKNIPMAAGLGGGSSDAAAALRLANQLWNCRASREDLARLGASLGSDVPFFLYGGACCCEGRGERVTPLAVAPAVARWRFPVIVPPWRVATACAYACYAREAASAPRRDAAAMIAALAAGDAEGARREAFNRFEEAVDRIAPGQRALREALRGAGMPGPWLSGSGPALWSLSAPGETPPGGEAAWQAIAARHGAPQPCFSARRPLS